jgi:hypothetical protein
MRPWSIALLFAALAATETRAEPMPTALRGKSLVLNWTRNFTLKTLSGKRAGRIFSNVAPLAIKLYVSLQGRIFSSYERRDWGTSEQVSGTGENTLHWGLEGGALVADEAEVEGVRRVIASSADGFVTCSMNVVFEKKAGTGSVVFEGTDDVQYELVDGKITSTSCTVQQGNIFDNHQ